MVKLLIVDDEPLVQIGIRSMLNWEKLGIEVAGTAANGKQAYDFILENQPEIVITDIKMPVMDGMELIEKCQSLEQTPLFILLTSYEEFHLVKQAISYQVLEYLVKLELTEEVLTNAIQKALNILEKRKKQTPAPENSSDLSLLVDNFYIRLLLNLFETEEQFKKQQDMLSVQLDASGYAVAYLEMQNTRQSGGAVPASDISLYQSSYQMIRSLIIKYASCHIVFLDTTHIAIIFFFEDAQTAQWKKIISEALSQVKEMLFNYYSIKILASIGSFVENPKEIYTSYSDARQIFPNVTQAEDAIVFVDEQSFSEEGHNVFNIAIFKDDLQRAFNEYNSEALTAVFHDIIELFHDDRKHYAQALSAASNVLHLTLSCLNNGEKQLNEIFQKAENGYNCLYEADSVPQILEWMQTLCNGLCDYFSEHNKDYKNRTISAVKKYIDEHVEEKITLNQLSELFNISPNYLSILFSKYNDLGFIDYVNHAKIECAKQLLDEGTLKVYEISDRLGYESAFYFSRVFKKIEGVSPREYVNRTAN